MLIRDVLGHPAIAVVLVACGGGGSGVVPGAAATGGAGNSVATGGAGGSAADQDGSVGGVAGGGAGGSGGSAGGVAGGGSAGTGGTTATLGPCAAPKDASKAALCLTLQPETIAFITDPQLDGKGHLLVEVFDAKGTSLATQKLPTDPTQEISVAALPVVRFDGLPAQVFLRTSFFDNPATEAVDPTTKTQDTYIWGRWIGGLVGLDQTPVKSILAQQYAPVDLKVGQGTSVGQKLTPIRYAQVRVTLGSGVTPLDDGQGPLAIGAYLGTTPSLDGLSGQGSELCVDIKAAAATVGVALVGAGPHYIAASLDDFNGGKDGSPGSLDSAPRDAKGIPIIPRTDVITFKADEYGTTGNLTLSHVVALGSGAAPAPYACPKP